MLGATGVAGFLLAACGSGSSVGTTTTTVHPTTTVPPTTTTVPPTTTAGRTLPVSVYFLRDGKVAAAHRDVPETTAIATAAMNALIAAPNKIESSAGLSTALPADQQFHDLAIAGGVATLSLSPTATLEAQAQVVYTLTQFPTVRAVSLGGQRLTRASFEDLTPAIFVESPAPGDVISSPVRIHGTANTFEATFVVKLVISGRQAFDKPVMATSGSGTRGTFAISIPFAAGSGGPATLTAYEESAENGRPINLVPIPVVVR
jgi:hypothetical protein